MWLRIAIDNLKACIPCKAQLRRIQRSIRPYRSLPSNDELALEQGVELVRLVHGHGMNATVVMEVGTGWIPTIPHIMHAYGAERLVLTDVERLSDPQSFDHAKKLVEGAIGRIGDACTGDPDTLRANLRRPLNYDYRCPPRLEELENGSVDLVYSRTVLEHIPEKLLRELLLTWKNLLRPGGYAVHFIDNSDHFEHRDKTLSRLNFLTLPDWLWRIASFNTQNYQNRLRHSQYIELFENAGYEIVSVEGKPDSRTLVELENLTLQKQFTRFDKAELAILTTVIVCRKPDSL